MIADGAVAALARVWLVAADLPAVGRGGGAGGDSAGMACPAGRVAIAAGAADGRGGVGRAGARCWDWRSSSCSNQPELPWLVQLYDHSILAPFLALFVRGLPAAIFVLWHALHTVPERIARSGGGRWRRPAGAGSAALPCRCGGPPSPWRFSSRWP